MVIDIRPGSATYLKHYGVELAEGDGRELYVPDGFAHGFQTLRDASEVHYMLSTRYVAEAAGGFRWDDPAFTLSWPRPITVISDRDRKWPLFRWKSQRMKLLIFGAYGQAGSSLRPLAEARGFAIDAPRRAALDVRNTQTSRDTSKRRAPIG